MQTSFSKENGKLKETKTETKVDVVYHDIADLKVSKENLLKDQQAYNDRVDEDIAIIDALIAKAEELGVKEEKVEELQPAEALPEEIVQEERI